ncbi:MAG: hypothetical protein KAI84_01130, partial [Gammaproteobacteria bacterium]|nr:hypothetical protein [Gammaproteobacteria bacterium]
QPKRSWQTLPNLKNCLVICNDVYPDDVAFITGSIQKRLTISPKNLPRRMANWEKLLNMLQQFVERI